MNTLSMYISDVTDNEIYFMPSTSTATNPQQGKMWTHTHTHTHTERERGERERERERRERDVGR